MKTKNSITRNKKAFFDYEILEDWEAGIELKGHEVKSIRGGQVNLKGAYVSTLGSEIFIKGMHVSPWKALPNTSHIEAERERKVYLKRKTIHYLQMKSKESGLSVIPIECYLKGSLIKIRVALCKGKKQYQKKDMLKRKTVEKDIRRAMSKSY